MAKILAVDDNSDILDCVKDVLKSERHSVDVALSADEAWQFIQTYEYDLFIFDWEMPLLSGVELLRKYRASGGKTPVVMLTAKDTVMDKIEGLDSGADNYLTKPFDSDELLGFVRAMLRRHPDAAQSSVSLRYGDLELKEASNQVICGSKSSTLSGKELLVLKLLIENSNRLIGHEELRSVAWPDSPETSSGTVRVFLTALRDKLKSIGSEAKILSVRGYGYQISK